jgi:glycosyltransferase involved in cell wall biosynthesis
MPTVSIITAVQNGLPLIERAYRSINQQTFADWEWLVVDDGSTDGTGDEVRSWLNGDPRIRLIEHRQSRGVATARNAALRAAQGELITYLDYDDEYYPDYLSRVHQFRTTADVLVFGYDMICDDGEAQGQKMDWDPNKVRDNLFLSGIVTPLGVAHRRDLAARVGGFNELLWRDEDMEFWRRLARAGARFVFLEAKCGMYHVRGGSWSRTGQPKPHQREVLERNWRAGRPIFWQEDETGNGPIAIAGSADHNPEREGDRPPRPVSKRERKKVRKIAFVSPHCVLDFTNGAATATLDGLALLAREGFECQAFCNSRLDSWEEVLVEEILARRGIRYEVRNAQIGAHRGRMIFTTHRQVGVTLFNSASTRGGWINREEIAAFLTACEIFLIKNRPDVVWTYGGDPVAIAVQQLAKRLDIPILFALHNLAYGDTAAFEMADYVVVPSEFCRNHYWETLGLASLKLPLVVDPGRMGVNRGADGSPCNRETGGGHADAVAGLTGNEAKSPHPNPLPEGEGTMRHVTFVNPTPVKGVHIFTRIAEVLSRRRPDVPLLVVEGASKASFLPQLGIDIRGMKNLRVMPNLPDARAFYAITKILLMPSLSETAGLVAMEAMLNGIPVVASNCGALPETIGDAGFLLDIPAKYTPETHEMPMAEEVEPWVEAIIRLWDDAAEYQRRSQAARERSEQWHPDQLAPLYRDFFGNLTHQPAPPLVPKSIANAR